MKAIPVGADLSLVTAKFMVWQFDDEKYGLKNIEEIKEDAELMSVCTDLVALYKRIISGSTVTDQEWEEIYARAGARAWAETGAGAGAWTRAGAWTYEIMADKLIEILQETK